MIDDMDEVQRFVAMTNRFRGVEREIFIKGSDRKENDPEHCYQLGMTAWYLIKRFKLPLDADVALKLGLVHDVPEVYAGDQHILDREARKKKATEEKLARERLRSEFPDFPDLHEHMEMYERHDCPEARFVSALDAILPIINVMQDNGRLWKMWRQTLVETYDLKWPKVSASPELSGFFLDLMSMLLSREHELFTVPQLELFPKANL